MSRGIDTQIIAELLGDDDFMTCNFHDDDDKDRRHISLESAWFYY